LEYRLWEEKAISEFGLLANNIFGYAGDIASKSDAHRKASFPKDKDERQAG